MKWCMINNLVSRRSEKPGAARVQEREDRLTDRRGQEGNEERRNVMHWK